jgi:hypothetical protein
MAARSFHVTTMFTLGKSNDPRRCEDVVSDGRFWAVLCDGATDKTGTTIEGKTAARVAAEVVADAVSSAPEGLSALDLIGHINTVYAERLGAATRDLPREALPTASFCAVEKSTGRVIRVGDTSWRTESRVQIGTKVIDEVRSHVRAAMLQALMIGGASQEELLAHDPARQMMKVFVQKQRLLQNTLDAAPYSHGVIDGRDVPAAFIEEWTLDPGETAVVLTSDGYPEPLMDFHETESVLAADLGKNKTTKGVETPNISFDDRAFIRLEELS